MPSRNTIKQYVENRYYHVYNRGVDKRIIFMDDQDYRVFLHLLKYYLSPLENQSNHPLTDLTGFIPVRLRILEPLSDEVDLIAYCLMPNHFHLLVKQNSKNGVTKLLRKISTTYSMYFNKRYKRVGHLFQGIFKAINIQEEPYLLHLTRYFHLNPAELTRMNPVTYPYSSYAYYLGTKNASWIKPQFILDFFTSSKSLFPKKINSYQNFVEDYSGNSEEVLSAITLEEE